MTQPSPQQIERKQLRRRLRKRISLALKGGILQLGLLAVTVVLWLILTAAGDESGAKAVGWVAVILGVIGVGVCCILLAGLARGVLALLGDDSAGDGEQPSDEASGSSFKKTGSGIPR